MDTTRKIELLEQQILEASDGDPTDFNLWRDRTEVVLRNVLGDASPLYESFKDVRYTLGFWSTSTPQSAFDQARRGGVRKAIAILQAAKMEVELSGGAPQPMTGGQATGTHVFVVHGHDDATKHAVARFLRAATGNDPVILHEHPDGGRTVIEKFEQYAAEAAFAVVIATPDDVGRKAADDELQPRARQNVVFEWGFFYGALGRDRVALLYEDTVERPSDIAGVVTIPLDANGAWKMLLARELEAAGLGIDWASLRR